MSFVRDIVDVGPDFGAADTQATFAFNNVIDDGYHYDGESSLDYLAGRGWTNVWLPIRWERIQPTLEGALDATELGLITDYLDAAQSAGLDVTLDLHNFGLYYTGGGTAGAASATGTRTALTSAGLVDVWERIMGSAIGSHAALSAVSIMCEPQSTGGLTRAVWRTASQNTVTAIRAINTDVTVYVSGWDWSSLEFWSSTEGASGWISTDTSDPNLYYEAHHYWDNGEGGAYSGTYGSYVTAAEGAGYSAGSYSDALQNRVMTKLADWKAWLDSNGVQGFVGEYGWPGPGVSSADQTSWNTLAGLYLTQLDAWGIGGGYWGVGTVYGASPDTIIAYSSSGGYIATLDTAESQAAVLEAHMSATSTTTQVSNTVDSAWNVAGDRLRDDSLRVGRAVHRQSIELRFGMGRQGIGRRHLGCSVGRSGDGRRASDSSWRVLVAVATSTDAALGRCSDRQSVGG